VPPHVEDGPFCCPDCVRSFESGLGLEMHRVRIHRQRGSIEPQTAKSPTEDDSIFQVSLTLPENDWLRMVLRGTREGRVRQVLDSARRKAARDTELTEDDVIREFWDGTDRRILENLRARGVAVHGRNPRSVEDEVDTK
jgi:hypothetical protein